MKLSARLETIKLPKVLAELKHANQFLKVFSLCSVTLNILSVALALVLVLKGPRIVALAPTGVPLTVDARPVPEFEVESAIRKYIELRYSWDAKTVKGRLSQAREFVHQSGLHSFDADLMDVQKFSVDRNVSQRGYASEINVDLSKQTARVRGDRVTTIQGLTAAGSLSLTLQFDSGPRTNSNPWGIYIVRERNE